MVPVYHLPPLVEGTPFSFSSRAISLNPILLYLFILKIILIISTRSSSIINFLFFVLYPKAVAPPA